MNTMCDITDPKVFHCDEFDEGCYWDACVEELSCNDLCACDPAESDSCVACC